MPRTQQPQSTAQSTFQPLVRRTMGKNYIRMDIVEDLITTTERLELNYLKKKPKKAFKAYKSLVRQARELRNFFDTLMVGPDPQMAMVEDPDLAPPITPVTPRVRVRKVVPAAAAAPMTGEIPRRAGRPRGARNNGPSFEESDAVLHTPGRERLAE